jgi:hypothetical protein
MLGALKIVINTLYTWISAHHSLILASFVDFLYFCSSYSFD